VSNKRKAKNWWDGLNEVPAYIPAAHYEVPTVALVAAILLEGDDYALATRRAITLMNECVKALRYDRNSFGRVQYKEAFQKKYGRDDEDPISLDHALMYATGKRRPGEARETYVSRLKQHGKSDSEIQSFLYLYDGKPMTFGEAVKLREEFRSLRRASRNRTHNGKFKRTIANKKLD
jgi:hypothetical protein